MLLAAILGSMRGRIVLAEDAAVCARCHEQQGGFTGEGVPCDRQQAMAAPTTRQKALEINLDRTQYGAFAEIGAGQEVARWFFRVGGAAGTIAETVSAYDKQVSDARYGSSKRYVSRERLQAMLDHEYAALQDRLAAQRGATTCFFVFADTVATAGYARPGEGDAWLGIRFQVHPGAEASEIVLHARLLDREAVRQQTALGVLGVNLVYGAFHHHAAPPALIASLLDGVDTQRVEIDVAQFRGSVFADVDNRLMSLQLVERRFTEAAMFTADAEMVQPSEVLYKRPILVERGRFRPITKLGLDILERARDRFLAEADVAGEAPVVLMEMTLSTLGESGPVSDHRDFLARADTLCSLGTPVLISNFGRYFRLADYLARHTTKPIAIAFGLPTITGILDPRYYDDLQGGVLESIGLLFKRNVRIYVYPQRDERTGKTLTLDDVQVSGALRHLLTYLVETGRLVPIHGSNPDYLGFLGDAVRAKIERGDGTWEDAVPPQVADAIKRNRLFGYRAREAQRRDG